MSLATRCPACTTSFRVVQDQLKVSAGWVRCGRCGEVFNALESLFDLDLEAPAATVQDEAPAPDAATVAATPEASDAGPQAAAPEASTLAAPPEAAPPPATPPAAPPPLPAAVASPASVPAFPPAPPALPTPVDASFILPAGATLLTAKAATKAEVETAPEDDTPPPDGRELTFVRQAERAARWHRPWVRGLLSLLALGLAALLVAQGLIAQRDLAAARWPALQPTLLQACAMLGCTVRPPQRIDLLAVESSDLTRVEGSPLYRLNLVLRNKGEWPLALPAVDLSVTDPAGQLVSRRVLQAAELGASQAAIAAGQELPLQALLAAGDKRLAGYSVEIFYP